MLFKDLVLDRVEVFVLLELEDQVVVAVNLTLRRLKFVLASAPHVLVEVGDLSHCVVVVAHAHHKLLHFSVSYSTPLQLAVQHVELLHFLAVLQPQRSHLHLELNASLGLDFKRLGQVRDLGSDHTQGLIKLLGEFKLAIDRV